jgi:cyclase
MRRVRIIPVLLLKGNGLYKTIGFKSPNYIGDPINAVKIFNDKGVDEIVILDIDATIEKRGPNFKLIEDIASECFMPMAYGGGISTVEQARKVFNLGVEKVVINSAFENNKGLISQVAHEYGSQSVVVSIDYKKSLLGSVTVYTTGGSRKTQFDPVVYAKQAVEAGAGELFVTSIDKDGTRKGYDLPLLAKITSAVNVPVIASGGADNIEDFYKAITESGTAAVAAGSMFVYKGDIDSILINYPSQEEINKLYARL